MFQSRRENNLPGWLWFFLILPMVLIVALLYRRRRLPALAMPKVALPIGRLPGMGERGVRRYVEPDSIPLNMGDAGDSTPEGERAAPIYTAGEMPQPLDEVPLPVDEFPLPVVEETRAAQPEEGVADDLKIVEGIGPAIERLLLSSGIHSFRDLASAPQERLVEILTQARLNRLADPGTWPEQARMAMEGRWEDLANFQATLRAGRRPKTE